MSGWRPAVLALHRAAGGGWGVALCPMRGRLRGGEVDVSGLLFALLAQYVGGWAIVIIFAVSTRKTDPDPWTARRVVNNAILGPAFFWLVAYLTARDALRWFFANETCNEGPWAADDEDWRLP